MGLGLIPSVRAAAAPQGTVQYKVSIPRPEQKRLQVAITVDPGEDRTVSFQIPTWPPGYYQILNFEKSIVNFRAFDGSGRELDVSSPDPNTWHVTTSSGTVTASYEVKAEDAGFGFFGSHVDSLTGYFNGPSALMYVVDGKQLPATLKLEIPAKWKVACSLDSNGENGFRAADYDELIDSPVQMGMMDRHDFTVKGIPFAAIIVGESNVDRAALLNTLKRVSAAGIDIFGHAPFKRYHYIIHMDTGNFGGGIEHRNSTVLNVWGMVTRQPHPWAALSAHEFFHAYNVKRIRPAVLGPFDYVNKVRTSSLWFAEGVTEYYAQVLLRKSGITSAAQFLGWMSNEISTLQSTGARLKISAEEASLKAWEGGSVGFGGLNYYLKGSLLGLLFDIKIRHATDNAKNLDDAMQLLDERYGKMNIGYPEDAILKAINEAAGLDLSKDYERYVRGVEEIPWSSILRLAGLRFAHADEKQAFFGISTTRGEGDGILVEEIVEETPAASSRLKIGDIITSLNGVRVRFDTWHANLEKLRPGQRVAVGVRRGSRAVKISVTVGTRPVPRSQILPDIKADARARRVRDGLLRNESKLSAKTKLFWGRTRQSADVRAR